VRRRLTLKGLAAVGLAGACAAVVQTRPIATTSQTGAVAARWTMQTSGVDARLRGVSAVSQRVAWASGARGTIVRTTDGGATWQRLVIPGTDKLDFRDIDAIDDRTAYALSIGPGEASQIYKTVDGGANWARQYLNQDPKAFFDAMTFWNADRGVVIGDSVDGQHFILLTRDGGRTWTRAPATGLPPALPNEGAFAASGTNIAVHGTDRVWIATNAPGASRVLRSRDGGRTWAVATTPLPAGQSSGIFSTAFRDAMHGVVVGGDYQKEGEAIDNAAFTSDGGVTWTLAKAHGLSGFRSVVAYAPTSGSKANPRALIAVGPQGADYSLDDGQTWHPMECAGFHTFSFAAQTAVGWGAGETGRIARLDAFPPRP
jgi:photosystem II stability/assembly factor-like uncharacterized protein